MYKVYYLTSEEDFNIPMYIGMTKSSLRDRLKGHKSHLKKYNKKDKWKNLRKNKITIHLIQDGISSYEECNDIEIMWSKFWKEINLELTNTIFHRIGDHAYIKHIEEVKKNISEGVIKAKCKNIVVLDLGSNFIKEFRTIKQASKEIKVKEGIISNNLKNKTKAKKFIFLYKEEYEANKNYSYKVFDVKKRKPSRIKAIISENCRNKIAKKAQIMNILTGEIVNFNSKREACKFLNVNDSYFERLKKKDGLINEFFKIL